HAFDGHTAAPSAQTEDGRKFLEVTRNPAESSVRVQSADERTARFRGVRIRAIHVMPLAPVTAWLLPRQ
ncbi:MAG TPA: hypothetical protein VGE78_02175, partial [Agromyces sp.]